VSPASDRWPRIWRLVEEIPPGRVASYGQIAELAGDRTTPRQVGYALAALPEGSDVPWQRVVNARGQVSDRSSFDGAPRQRLRLIEEGVEFDAGDRIDLDRFGWRPRRGTGPTIRRSVE
jgi:methylated-DNA-protein-cysteine methyltransferase-like protein